MIDKTITNLPLVLSTKDVAEVLGVSMTTVYHLVNSGELKSVRVRRQIRVTRDALLDYLKVETHS